MPGLMKQSRSQWNSQSSHDHRRTPFSPSSQLRRRHILCVDDEIAGTRLRGEILEEHGYSTLLCHCPIEVLTCDVFSFDLAVLDFQMPGLNGRDLFLRLRALGARFPVILLSGCLSLQWRLDLTASKYMGQTVTCRISFSTAAPTSGLTNGEGRSRIERAFSSQ